MFYFILSLCLCVCVRFRLTFIWLFIRVLNKLAEKKGIEFCEQTSECNIQVLRSKCRISKGAFKRNPLFTFLPLQSQNRLTLLVRVVPNCIYSDIYMILQNARRIHLALGLLMFHYYCMFNACHVPIETIDC